MSGHHFAVCHIATAVIIYSGKSLTTAASKLKPGTCWGRGWTTEKAVTQANQWREYFASRRTGSE
jgi:hypothetical protein